KSRDGARQEIVSELANAYPNSPSVLDLFSGRAMIPLEAVHLNAHAYGIDYSPVATLAGKLLADYPFRVWSDEPQIPYSDLAIKLPGHRIVEDISRVLNEIGARYNELMARFYPQVNGKQPWAYLWAVTLPCQECGHRFPLTGSLLLR